MNSIEEDINCLKLMVKNGIVKHKDNLYEIQTIKTELEEFKLISFIFAIFVIILLTIK